MSNLLTITRNTRTRFRALRLFSMLVCKRLSETANGIGTRLYSPHPFPHRGADSHLRDAFSRDAWAALNGEKQLSFARIEQINGKRMVRYAVPDRMTEACVACHSVHSQSPCRDWEVGQIRGALEDHYPLAPVMSRMDVHDRSVNLIAINLTFATPLSVG